MVVIERNKSISVIAPYEATLGPKVARFEQARNEVQRLVDERKKLAARSAEEVDELDAVTRGWGANLQLSTSLALEDIGISSVRTAEAILDSGRQAMQAFGRHGELDFAAQALSEIEAKHSSAKAAYDATQAARVALQVQQREQRAACCRTPWRWSSAAAARCPRCARSRPCVRRAPRRHDARAALGRGLACDA